MVDGAGTPKYTYDSLNRLVQSINRYGLITPQTSTSRRSKSI